MTYKIVMRSMDGVHKCSYDHSTHTAYLDQAWVDKLSFPARALIFKWVEGMSVVPAELNTDARLRFCDVYAFTNTLHLSEPQKLFQAYVLELLPIIK